MCAIHNPGEAILSCIFAILSCKTSKKGESEPVKGPDFAIPKIGCPDGENGGQGFHRGLLSFPEKAGNRNDQKFIASGITGTVGRKFFFKE
jgi:hypothetical protein